LLSKVINFQQEYLNLLVAGNFKFLSKSTQRKHRRKTPQPKKFYIFSVTREASVALPRQRKCFFAYDGSLLAKGSPVFII